MAFNGSGTYTLPGAALTTGATVSSTENNTFRNDVATAFNKTLTRDGQAVATANLPMGGFKLTGLGAATTAGEALSYGQAASVSDLAYTGTLTGGTGVVNLGSGQLYKDASGNLGVGTTTGTSKITATGVVESTTGGFKFPDGTTQTTAATSSVSSVNGKTGAVQSVVISGTAVASTSGTSIDFTSIPSWVKRITVMFKAVSTNGSSPVMVQLGSGSIDATGYAGSVDFVEDNSAGTTFSTGFAIDKSLGASDTRTGHMTIVLFGSNNWNETSTISNNATALLLGAGDKTLSGTLDRVRITTVGGTDTFDAGSVNILYE
jgi:hypothetical protein